VLRLCRFYGPIPDLKETLRVQSAVIIVNTYQIVVYKVEFKIALIKTITRKVFRVWV
jgi:hypothetical protein